MGTTASIFQTQHAEPNEKLSGEASLVDDSIAHDLQPLSHAAPLEEVEPEEQSLRNRRKDRDIQIFEKQNENAKFAFNSELLKEQEDEIAMGIVASTFLPQRKVSKHPFKYNEFESLRKLYHNNMVTQQMAKISRLQNQSKIDQESSSRTFLKIHKAFSDLEGWGPGLQLSFRKGDWIVVGISETSGNASGIRLSDRLLSIDGFVVTSMTFEQIQSHLLGPKDSNVTVAVSRKSFVWSSHQQHVLIRSLPSASFNFSSQEVVQKTLLRAQFVEDQEEEAYLEERKQNLATKLKRLADEQAILAEESALLTLQQDYVKAPQMDDSTLSHIFTTITENVRELGHPSFMVSIHHRSSSKELKHVTRKLADTIAILIRSYSMEPVINVIDHDDQQSLISSSTWRSSIEQGACTNGIPLCVLVWDLKHWKIWQQWMKTHYEKMSEINLSVDAYRKLLLNFDDDDFIQEALHIFSSSAAQVSRIFILVDDSIEPSALAECVGVDLMQTWFCVALPQLVFIYAQKIKVKSMFLKRIHYASVESIFQNSQIASAHYFSNLFNLIFKGASGFTTCFHGLGPDIRNIICSGKLVITSKFIPKKKKCFSREQLAKSYENVVEQSSLKQPQHFILYSMINDWPSRPVSQNPGKKIFFFTPEISGFSSTLDWIFESLIAAPEGLDDIVPILIRIPKIFHETGLAESQYLLFALHSAVYETLSSPPFNFEGGIDSNIDASSDSPEHLMESLSKILSVACKQLCIRILIMIDNIHYIKFDTDSMGCIHWALSRMPENVRIVFPFLLKSPLHSALKTYIGSIQKSSLADSSDIALLEGLEYRKVPVFTSHQRYFFGCFVKSGTAYRLAAEKLCEDYFSWHLQVNSNIEHHIWLLIATGYVMIHRIWNIGIKPIDSVLSSDLKSMVAFIIQDFSSVLSGTTMLTAVRIMAAAKYGITMIDVIKIMMILSGHREEIYKQQYEYHQMCRILFQFSGQAQALERFCCIFARTEGKGFSMSNLLLMHRLVHQLLNEVILELHAPILDVPTSDALSFIILDFLQASCNMKPVENSKTARRSGVIIEGDGNFISQTCVLGQHRHLLILTDFAMHIGDTKFFLSALNNIGLIQSRIVLGCIHWVLGNILQVMRMVESYQESEMKMVFLLFRSLLNHRSRTMVLEIQPDLYYSILSTIPHKELLCKAALDFLQLSHLPWLRLANKQEYFQFPIIQFSDLPFAATTVATSKRGHLIGAGDFSGNIAVWRVSSSDLLSIFKSHSRSITGIAFSSLDYIVISCSSDNSININSVYSSSVLTTLNPHNQPVICLDIWSKDSDTFASVSRDGLAAVATLNLRAIAARSTAWKAVQSRQAQSEFSDEELGSLLLQPSSFVFTFQVSSFDVMAENVHTNFVDCIACHPTDREVCATGSRDSSIFIWKVDFVHSCSSCLFRYLGHNHWILSLDWMQTGYTLLSSSMSSDIHVWHIPFESNCKQHSVPQSAIDAAFSAKAEKSYDAKSGSPVKDQALLHHGIVRGSLHPEVTEHTTFSLTLQDACDFSEFDGARIFMEREEREITLPSFAVLERSALGTSLAMRSDLCTVEKKVAARSYTTHADASIVLNLTDASFPWRTADATKQYASRVRFLGTEFVWLMTIENESLTYDTKNHIMTSLFQSHTEKINAVVFSPFLDVFFTASSDKFIKAWDISRAPEHKLLEHRSAATTVTIIVIGQQCSNLFDDSMDCTFFYGCSDGSLGANKCRKSDSSQQMSSTEFSLSSASVKHKYGVISMSYFRNRGDTFSDIIASGDENGGIMLWNASDRKHLRTLATTKTGPIISSHLFLPLAAPGEDLHLNLFTISGDGFGVVWNADTGNTIRFVTLIVPTVTQVHMCTDSTVSALRHPGSNIFTLIDYETLANLGSVKSEFFASESEKLKYLTLSLNGERCALGSSTGDICLLELYSRQIIAIGKHHQKEVTILLWTSFMNRLVSTSRDSTLAFWDGFMIPYEEAQSSDVLHPAFTPIIFQHLDANLISIKECANIPWLMVTMDDRSSCCIWNIATADAICKVAVQNSSPAIGFYGKALCCGNANENIPLMFSLEHIDTLSMVRGQSSLLTEPGSQSTLAQEQLEMRMWKTKFSKRV